MEEQDINLKQNIIAQLGLQDLPEEKRFELLDNMTTLIEKRIMLRLMEELSDEDIEKVEALADKEEELAAFMADKVPNLALVIEQETQKVKSDMMLAGHEDEASTAGGEVHAAQEEVASPENVGDQAL